jgi:quercetin dioxygenase-like cupin family protein
MPHPAHQHSDEELIIIKEGELEVVQNGVTNHASPGAVIFEASNERHGLRNDGRVPATYYVIKFSSGSMKN